MSDFWKGKTWAVADHDDGWLEMAECGRFGRYEIRPLHQDPCEWEDEPVWGDEPNPTGIFPATEMMLRSEHCLKIGCNYCPMCGRKLEVK